MLAKGIHHVSAITRNIQHNYYFMTKILGLRLVKRQLTKMIQACITYSMRTIKDHLGRT